MTDLGKRLITAAKQARAIARGDAHPSTYRVRRFDMDVQAIRKRLGLSQSEFAARYRIPVGTLRDWEQHRRDPEGPARTLLTVIAKDPKAVERALADV
ncbi:MAG: helix-turn-helix domain-containing protein [Hyphomicrobiales bacterium]|nr:helix-turn-helix domain-containing protein [Hyphomicrobiales bacterium]